MNDNCDALDTTNALSEWNSFDCCSGHAEQTGDYHYHFPPSCLLNQIGDFNDGHSAQIGWSYDGFPVYGPKGPGGIDMKYAPTACDDDSCTIDQTLDLCDGSICLDKCGGYEGTIAHDEYLYRYYMVGATSDLYSLPSDPRPGADAAAVFGFSLNCYRGYTLSELSAGATSHTPGTTNSFVPAVKTTPGQYTCISECQSSGGSSTAQGYFCSDVTGSSCNSLFDPTSVPDYSCSSSGDSSSTTTTSAVTASTTTTTAAVETTESTSAPTTTTTVSPTTTTTEVDTTKSTSAPTTTNTSTTVSGPPSGGPPSGGDSGSSTATCNQDGSSTTYVML